MMGASPVKPWPFGHSSGHDSWIRYSCPFPLARWNCSEFGSWIHVALGLSFRVRSILAVYFPLGYEINDLMGQNIRMLMFLKL
jgi:hypothetical protein